MATKDEKRLLNLLLDKYEKSKAFREHSAHSNVLLHPLKDAKLQEELENPDRKQLFLAALRSLQSEGLISYQWEPYEEGNLVRSIHLVLDPDKIAESYRMVGRTPKSNRVDMLLNQIADALESGRLEEGGLLWEFLQTQRDSIQKKRTVTRYFFDVDHKSENLMEPECVSRNRALLDCLCAIDENRREQEGDCMERVLSSRLFGDSKYFEHYLKKKVLSILRSIHSEITDEELLEEYGIVRWPEIFEFTGNLCAVRKDGAKIDFGLQPYGAYTNSQSIQDMDHIELNGVRRILFIENKANYVWYSLEKRQPDELVLYHGGCYSPSKKKWFLLILAAAGPETEVCHWSDIDLGGFLIFTRLKRNVAPQLQPWKMDRETLREFESQAISITDGAYLKKLEKLLDDPDYAVFHDVICYMLAHRIRLEQEQCIR